MSAEIDKLCVSCGAKCCRYFCFEVDKPDTFEEFQNLRWFLLHEGITIHVDEGKWFISIDNKCKNLTDTGLCADYERRPMICRTYSADGCDAVEGDYEYEQLFTTEDEIIAYARKTLGEYKYDKQWAKLCGLPKPEKPKKGGKAGKAKGAEKDKGRGKKRRPAEGG